MREADANRYSFRTTEIAIVAAAFLVVITIVNCIVLATPVAPGVNLAAALALYVPFLLVIYAGLIRGMLMKVEIDTDGILVKNFWRTRRFGWDEFARFEAPSDVNAGVGACGTLVTKSGKSYPLTAIQARNINVILGKRDGASDKLVDEMTQASDRMKP